MCIHRVPSRIVQHTKTLMFSNADVYLTNVAHVNKHVTVIKPPDKRNQHTCQHVKHINLTCHAWQHVRNETRQMSNMSTCQQCKCQLSKMPTLSNIKDQLSTHVNQCQS